MAVYTGFRLLPLLAEHAQDAVRPGPCALCRLGVRTGQRIAQLASGDWAHTWCAGLLAVPDRERRKIKQPA